MITHRNPILRTLALPCLVAWLAVAPATRAQEKASTLDFSLDPASTVIHWTLNTNVHTVHGTFKLKNGTVHIDPATGNASGLIVIDATSGDSGDSTRDKRMNSVVLETSRFPDVTFRPTHVQGKVDLNAPGPITLEGVLNLHGQDHPIELAVDLHPKDAGLASQTHFTIPFVAWGMKDPSVLLFRTDKQVAIDIEATAVHSADTARLR